MAFNKGKWYFEYKKRCNTMMGIAIERHTRTERIRGSNAVGTSFMVFMGRQLMLIIETTDQAVKVLQVLQQLLVLLFVM